MALIYRAYFALSRSPRITSTGRNTNAQFGFTNTLLELLNKEKPSHLAVVFEGGGSDTDVHRTATFADYKANRADQPEDIRDSLPDIKAIIDGFNLPSLSSRGYEADDVIGTIAKKAVAQGYEVYMVTPDKDMGQLVGDGIYMYKPGYMGSSHEILDSAAICAKWNIKRVDQVIDILGLMGDAVDNIPGIAGVGEKTAAKLLAEYDSVEGVIENAAKIKGAIGEKVRAGIESAIMSKQLATIMIDAPIEFNEADCKVEEWNKEALIDIFTKLEFKAIGRRILGDDFAPPAATTQTSLDLFGNPIKGGANLPLKPVVNYVADLELPEATHNIENTPHSYHLVNDEAALEKLLSDLAGKSEIAFDTETTSTDANLAEMVGMSFCWEAGVAYYVPVPADRKEADALLAKFKPLFDNATITWIGQNLKYDFLLLKWYGITPKGRVWDTMLAHYLLEPEGKRNMDLLANRYLGYQTVSITSLIGKKGKDQITMREVPVETVSDYAAEDADIVWKLRDVFAPQLAAEKMEDLFKDIEAPLVPVLVDMEFEGVGIDVPFLNDYSKVLEGDLKTAEEAVFAEAGMKFNIGSPKQLGEVLFDIMKIEGGGKKTKTGQYATGEEVLTKLQGKHPIVDSIISYRELSKLKATYVDALPLLLNPKTGRIHTSFNQTVASTGRLSSSNPNLQNIPIRTDAGREIRKAFIPRGEDWTLVSADYSQIELRIIAAIAEEKTMMEAFATGKDVHTATAAKIYGVPDADVTTDMRRVAKTTNFGIIYGQSAFGLAGKLGIGRKEASEIINSYFEQYPAIGKYIEDRTLFAKQNHYAETLLGRRRWLRDINSSNPTVRAFAERNAINMPIQGTAADMIKLAMIAVHEALETRGLESKMVLQVHDELIFDVPKGELEEVRALIEEAMLGAMVLPNGVALKAETGSGANWLEAH